MVLFMRECICINCAEPALAQINVSSSSSRITIQSDDDEDFLPYQGENFAVFDWMLFKVYLCLYCLSQIYQ